MVGLLARSGKSFLKKILPLQVIVISYFLLCLLDNVGINTLQYNYCKTLIFSEPFNLAKLAIEIKTLKIKAAKIK